MLQWAIDSLTGHLHSNVCNEYFNWRIFNCGSESHHKITTAEPARPEISNTSATRGAAEW